MRTRTASDAKARWRDIVSDARKHGEVTVTNHERAEVVVLSIERYEQLKKDAEAHDPLETLRAAFDHELAVLNAPSSAAKLRRAFRATPAQLGKAANAAARRKR